jgi:hypothetical protein
MWLPSSAADSATSAFAPGHHARVVPRGEGGRLRAIRERQICACGCGALVQKPGSRFRHGHYSRTANAPRPPHLRLLGPKKPRVCPVCGSEKLVSASAAPRWKACSRAHYAILRHGLPKDGDPPLKSRILAYMRAHSMSLVAFAPDAWGMAPMARAHGYPTRSAQRFLELARGAKNDNLSYLPPETPDHWRTGSLRGRPRRATARQPATAAAINRDAPFRTSSRPDLPRVPRRQLRGPADACRG